MTGLEPANTGTTIQCLNHLATPAIIQEFMITRAAASYGWPA